MRDKNRFLILVFILSLFSCLNLEANDRLIKPPGQHLGHSQTALEWVPNKPTTQTPQTEPFEAPAPAPAPQNYEKVLWKVSDVDVSTCRKYFQDKTLPTGGSEESLDLLRRAAEALGVGYKLNLQDNNDVSSDNLFLFLSFTERGKQFLTEFLDLYLTKGVDFKDIKSKEAQDVLGKDSGPTAGLFFDRTIFVNWGEELGAVIPTFIHEGVHALALSTDEVSKWANLTGKESMLTSAVDAYSRSIEDPGQRMEYSTIFYELPAGSEPSTAAPTPENISRSYFEKYEEDEKIQNITKELLNVRRQRDLFVIEREHKGYRAQETLMTEIESRVPQYKHAFDKRVINEERFRQLLVDFYGVAPKSMELYFTPIEEGGYGHTWEKFK
ncbi:MAG: hypothetical protein A3F16_06150 [Deltaproteobacteria bacterium RIFCSPHIGHO2_12_FULL_43_9]|nr:MAG: hypothetical protein A3F16_06150 [Deltaproteobacteria bacterium RIFCSPHIGHO2_12_FULL_43_9]